MLNQRNYLSPISHLEANLPEDEDVSDDGLPPEESEGSEHCPIILLSKEEKIQMRRRLWRHSLIIKMFNGKVAYMGLMRKLKKKWSLKGDMVLIDIGCKFYIARFTSADDYHHVLT